MCEFRTTHEEEEKQKIYKLKNILNKDHKKAKEKRKEVEEL